MTSEILKIIGVICIFIAFLLILRLSKKSKTVLVEGDVEKYSIAYLVDCVKEVINDITRANLNDLSLSEESFTRQLHKRTALKTALKKCSFGSVNDKEYVKDFIYDVLKKRYINKDNIDKFITFNRHTSLSVEDKFDILLYHFKREYGYNALAKMIEKYRLDGLKNITEDAETFSYIITDEDIETVFDKEQVYLSFEDKLRILSQRVYQMYKGFGVVDEIRDMNIDGLSGGVSGVTDLSDINYFLSDKEGIVNLPANYDSIWIFYKGKTINLDFLSFKSENELKRICQNIYRYNKAGQISEKDGYKINEMKDGSRVVVVRPSFSESWAFFVRKFHIKNMALDNLIKGKDSFIPIELVKFLAKGGRITAITGSQGSGKTTLLMAMIKCIYATYTLRIEETAFELHLRNVYPKRNILTFKETDTVSGREGLDVQKKTDGSVSIVGEVASDEVAVWMLGVAQVASKFTLFTHHAKTSKDLVLSLRNSLLKQGVFRDEEIAKEQVVSVIDFDIHLEKDYKGNRYISRITEIIKCEDKQYNIKDLSKLTRDEKLDSFIDLASTYFMKKTDRQTYIARDIMVYEDGTYVAKNPISKTSFEAMKNMMSFNDRVNFERFISEFFSEERLVG